MNQSTQGGSSCLELDKLESPAPAAVRADAEAPIVTLIAPQSRFPSLGLRELWTYRDLLFVLVWRDVSANYRQSVIGFGWAIVKPVVSMLIFTIIFGRVAKLSSDGVPYPVFCYAALLPWMYFSTCLTSVSNSVVKGSGLLTKVYFPRLVLPLSCVVIGMIDFAIQFLVLVLLMVWYGITPSLGILLLPASLLLCAATALAVGVWLTALNVKYRDIHHVVPFVAQAWMWLTPIVYSSSMIPAEWRTLYGLNPMVGVVESFRWALIGTTPPDWGMMACSIGVVVVLLTVGLYYFRRVERTFADII